MNEMTLTDHQINTVNTVCDALFGKIGQPKQATLEDALVLAKSLAAMLLELKRANPDSVNIEEAEDMACSIVIDLAGEIRNRDNYEAHPAKCPCESEKCPCDDCVAQRSDEHYDRKREGTA